MRLIINSYRPVGVWQWEADDGEQPDTPSASPLVWSALEPVGLWSFKRMVRHRIPRLNLDKTFDFLLGFTRRNETDHTRPTGSLAMLGSEGLPSVSGQDAVCQRQLRLQRAELCSTPVHIKEMLRMFWSRYSVALVGGTYGQCGRLASSYIPPNRIAPFKHHL